MTPNRNKKDGIALVAVLGFLGVMLLMAVALSISMRTERLISESGLDDVRTRQLVRTGLARAMADVNQFMIETDPTTGNPALAAQQPAMIHLPREYALFPSISTDGSADKLESDADLISGEMLDWLPAKYLVTDGGDFDAAFVSANDAEWINISDPNTNIILGRVAYLVADCTGLLDINLINDGGNPVRTEGASIGEINAKLLPEIREGSRALNLDKNKSFYHRFDSLPEIIYLNDGIGGSDSYKEPLAVSGDILDNLVPYSLAYDRGWWNWAATASSRGWQGFYPAGGAIPLVVTNWTLAHAQAVFTDLDYARAADMAVCFVDYTDSNSIPGGTVANTDIPCCEQVPMLSELGVRATLTSNAGVFTLTFNVDVEVAFPFPPMDLPTNYTINLVSFTYLPLNKPGFSPLLPVVPNPPTETITLGGGPVYIAKTFQYQATAPGTLTGPLIMPNIRDFNIEVRDSGGSLVDKMPVVVASDNSMTLQLPNLFNPIGGEKRSTYLACNDPRVNHQSTLWERPAGNTLNAPNSTVNGWNRAPNGAFEGPTMYVRNGPMQNVAEMGFIPTGEPWGTIDLLSGQGAELLSKFRSSSLTNSSPYFSGAINPHSLNTSVWSSVLADCPMSEYPGDAGAKLVDASLAGLLAKAITDYNADDDSWGTNSFDGLADWVAIPALSRGGYDLWGAPNNNMQVEGVIRNSYRLFNPNQNLFTIIVVAQAINDQGVRGVYESDTDTILGERRAVALVWRDPFMGKAGRNEMFIRMFRYIDQ